MQSQSNIIQTLKVVTEIEAYRLQLSTLPDSDQEKMICVFNQNKPSFEIALKSMALEYQDFLEKLNSYLYSDLIMLTQYDALTDKFVINEPPAFPTELLPMVSNPPTQAQMNAFGFYNEEEIANARANKRVHWCKQKYSQVLKKHRTILNENRKLPQENISFLERYCRKIIENNFAEKPDQNIFSEILEATLSASNSSQSDCSSASLTVVESPSVSVPAPAAVIFSISPKLKKVTPAFEGKTDCEIITSIAKECNVSISECECVPMLNRSKFPENNARDKIAALLIEELQKKEWPKEREIMITDIGSGKLKQAATIACALVREGYSIKFNLVDSEYENKQEAENRIMAFEKILRILNDNFAGNASVNAYSDKYSAIQHSSDFFLVIDDIHELRNPDPSKPGGEAIYKDFCSSAKAQNPAVVCIATKRELFDLKVICDDKIVKYYTPRSYKPIAVAVGKKQSPYY